MDLTPLLFAVTKELYGYKEHFVIWSFDETRTIYVHSACRAHAEHTTSTEKKASTPAL